VAELLLIARNELSCQWQDKATRLARAIRSHSDAQPTAKVHFTRMLHLQKISSVEDQDLGSKSVLINFIPLQALQFEAGVFSLIRVLANRSARCGLPRDAQSVFAPPNLPCFQQYGAQTTSNVLHLMIANSH
jgi:hypothetical protein